MKRRLMAMWTLGLVLTLLGGCRADDETLRGEAGEFCNNRDEDCRQGLVCDLGVCTDPGGGPTYSCEEACERLAECDAAESTCSADCRITTRGWSVRALDAFGICLVEDLSCEEARRSFPPQTCYERIPIPTDRETFCETGFADVEATCPSTSDSFREACTRLARVGTSTDFASARDRCNDALASEDCEALTNCVNAPASTPTDG